MHSIRTNINKNHKQLFKLFCEENGLGKLYIGEYVRVNSNIGMNDYICYAYSDLDTELCEVLTCLILKHGSTENAFKSYLNKHYGALV